MRKKQMPVAKSAIQELSGDQLEVLAEFSKSEEFEILKELADKEKYKRYQMEFLTVSDMEEVSFLRGLNVGIDFILDSANRAKEELKARGAQVDSEE